MTSEWQGRTIDGRYEVLGVLGQGGMGVVLRGRHKYTGAEVALKVLHPHLRLQGDLAARFLAEARAPTAIGHPGIVSVTDAGRTPEGDLYLAMELLKGVGLGAVMRRGPMPLGDVVRIGGEVLDALGAAHAAGFVHRDLKPDNIFITHPTGAVKLLDFGIAKVVSEIETSGSTATGAVMGTVAYMSPEQLRDSRKVDKRTDFWALGVTIYQMLAGALPYEAETFGEMLIAVMSRPARPLVERLGRVPPGVDALLARSLAVDPAARFGSAAEMQAALRALGPGTGVGRAHEITAHPAAARAPEASAPAGYYGHPASAARPVTAAAPPPPRLSQGGGPPAGMSQAAFPPQPPAMSPMAMPPQPPGPTTSHAMGAPQPGPAHAMASALALLPPVPGAGAPQGTWTTAGGVPPPYYPAPPPGAPLAPLSRRSGLDSKVVGVGIGCGLLVLVVAALLVMGVVAGGTHVSASCTGEGCYALGLQYERGQGVEKDDVKAVELYRKSCDDAYMLGCNALGNSYMNGFGGLPKDYREARKLYETVCERGTMEGCHNLGWLYLNGLGVPKEEARARAYFARSCAGGNAPSCEYVR